MSIFDFFLYRGKASEYQIEYMRRRSGAYLLHLQNMGACLVVFTGYLAFYYCSRRSPGPPDVACLRALLYELFVLLCSGMFAYAVRVIETELSNYQQLMIGEQENEIAQVLDKQLERQTGTQPGER